jgi:hypothetical protein
LHVSPSPSTSDSSKPILAGAQDFRYPVHCITEYFLSVIESKQYTIKYTYLLLLLLLLFVVVVVVVVVIIIIDVMMKMTTA